MSASRGHDPGQPFDWAEYVAWLAAEHGSLAGAADRLAAQRGHVEDASSIERALRRLRTRGQSDGGTWGRRCLHLFGLPASVEARLRWMGHYHSRFTDLPVALCLDTLRAWDRPPVIASPARAWIALGLASVALRREDRASAQEQLARVMGNAPPAALAERALVASFIEAREHPEASATRLDEAALLIDSLPEGKDRACLFARAVDQRGWVLNVQRRDHAAAYALYETIEDDGPPFARVRRSSGLGWSALLLGRRDEASAHARRAVAAAGDGGHLRLRAMSLQLLARTLDGDVAVEAAKRARAIADALDDETLRLRGERR
ncbi:MAG: hypothetical protein AB7S26_10485, partial [Sandaracinaceae bacterium]